MLAASKLAQWVENVVDLPCYYVKVPEDIDTPEYPYLILAENKENLSDQSLSRQSDTTSVELYVSIVDSTPGNVISTRSQTREVLNPNKYGVDVALEHGLKAFVKRSPNLCQPVAVDTESKLDASGRQASFAIDVYLVNMTSFTPPPPQQL